MNWEKCQEVGESFSRSSKQADHYGVPRIAYINKMDITGADFFRSVETMRDRLHTNPVPIQIPIGKEDHFDGIIDLMTMKAEMYEDEEGKQIVEKDIPEDMLPLAQE